MTTKERSEFKAYLIACTDRQVCGVYEKEQKAWREDYAELAHTEAARRNIILFDE